MTQRAPGCQRCRSPSRQAPCARFVNCNAFAATSADGWTGPRSVSSAQPFQGSYAPWPRGEACSGKPFDHFADDERLPLGRLRVQVLRIVMDGKAVLRALDFQQSRLRMDLPNIHPRTLDGDERVLGAVHDQGGRADLGDFLVRAEIEDLVQQWPAEFERRRVPEKSLRSQLPTGLVINAVIVPIGLVVDEPLLVVHERVEQHQPPNLVRMTGGETAADATTEARANQVD